MIRRDGEYRRELRTNYRGAPGQIRMDHLMEPEEFYHQGRLFSRCTLEPGSGVGYHVHHGEMEIFYILEGRAEVRDQAGEIQVLNPGDSMLTGDGEGHSLLAVGESTLVYLAAVLFHKA